MKNKAEDLKACPFCGQKVNIVEKVCDLTNRRYYGVFCQNSRCYNCRLGYFVYRWISKSGAKRAWNKRSL